jgi:hypothetical protein
LEVCCGEWPLCRCRLDKSWQPAGEQPEIKKGEREVSENLLQGAPFSGFQVPWKELLGVDPRTGGRSTTNVIEVTDKVFDEAYAVIVPGCKWKSQLRGAPWQVQRF